MFKSPHKYYLQAFGPLVLLMVMGMSMPVQTADHQVNLADLAKPVEKSPSRLDWLGLSASKRESKVWPLAKAVAAQHGLDPALVMAVVRIESNFRPWATSPRGAMGLMQINRVTAKHLGLATPLEPDANLEAGVRYLAGLHRQFAYDLTMTLAAYNAGPTRVAEQGAVPEIVETRQFISRVIEARDYFRSKYQALARN